MGEVNDLPYHRYYGRLQPVTIRGFSDGREGRYGDALFRCGRRLNARGRRVRIEAVGDELSGQRAQARASHKEDKGVGRRDRHAAGGRSR